MTKSPHAGPQIALPFSRPITAMGLAATGISIAGFFLVIGYVLIVGLLDATCCPPLEAQGNFGQFGLLIILIAPMLLLVGATFVLIPYLQWWAWTLCCVFICGCLYALTSLVEPLHDNPLHVTNVALYVIGILFCFLGITARFVYCYCEQEI